MKVFVFVVFLIVAFTSSFVRCDEEEDNHDLEPRHYGRKPCTSHPDCEQHQYCKYGWYKYCKNLPRCKYGYRCPRHTVCKRSNNVFHYGSFGQCVRTGTCTSHRQCNQATECCKSNRYASHTHCAKRPQEGQTCCPKYACWQCAEGLECTRQYWYQKYGKCRAVPTTARPTTERPTTFRPTTIAPTTEEGSGSGEYDRALVE